MNIRPLVLLFLLLAPLLRADQTIWKLPENPSFLQLLPVPPVQGSPADKADLDGVIAAQAHPTKAELAHAEKSVGYSVFTFAEVRGENFTAAHYPKTAVFFKKLEATTDIPKNWLKDNFHRERPYKAFPDKVKALVKIEGNYSYPSGHSTRSWLAALVMGNLDPARRADYLASAMQVNADRVIGGMHYPSDTAAGRILAEALYADLLADPGFVSELEELRKAEYPERTSP